MNSSGSFFLNTNQQTCEIVQKELTRQYNELVSHSQEVNNDQIIHQLISPYDIFPEELDRAPESRGSEKEEVAASPPVNVLVEAWSQSLLLNDRALQSSALVLDRCRYQPLQHLYDTPDQKQRVNQEVQTALHWWGIRLEPLLLSEIVQRCPKRPPPPPPPPPSRPVSAPIAQSSAQNQVRLRQ